MIHKKGTRIPGEVLMLGEALNCRSRFQQKAYCKSVKSVKNREAETAVVRRRPPYICASKHVFVCGSGTQQHIVTNWAGPLESLNSLSLKNPSYHTIALSTNSLGPVHHSDIIIITNL